MGVEATGKFDEIIERFVRWAAADGEVLAALMIGSQARADHPADECSDLDLMLFVKESERFLRKDEWLQAIGPYHISFIERALGGYSERRVLFEGALDVDFVICPQEAVQNLPWREMSGILARGYRVLVDKAGLGEKLKRVPEEEPVALMGAEEFQNLAGDFWYHAVWIAKKLVRGELFTAVACLNGYMQWRLLAMIEGLARAIHGTDYDTWHSGRFMEEWAEPWIVERMVGCWSGYGEKDAKRALMNIMGLFREVSSDLANRRHFVFRFEAECYATEWVKRLLEEKMG